MKEPGEVHFIKDYHFAVRFLFIAHVQDEKFYRGSARDTQFKANFLFLTIKI